MDLLVAALAFLPAIAFGVLWARQRNTDATLPQRVSTLERELPAWKLAMEQLADQCEDVLESAERKRRAAKMAERRAGRTSDDDAPDGIESGEAAPSPNEQRAAILRESRARRGIYQ